MPETGKERYKMILANGSKVKVTLKEIRDFITEMPSPIPNAYWRHSELLSEEEVMRFLKRESSEDEVRKIARYLLIYTENLAFTGYLFDKSESKPDQTREFNIPALKKLRELYQKVKDNRHDISPLVNEMESVCMQIGADPL